MTSSSLLLTTCHVAQKHTFHSVVPYGRADQLTNWDGTQKVGFGTPPKKESQGLSGNDNERRFIAISTTNHLKLQKCDA